MSAARFFRLRNGSSRRRVPGSVGFNAPSAVLIEHRGGDSLSGEICRWIPKGQGAGVTVADRLINTNLFHLPSIGVPWPPYTCPMFTWSGYIADMERIWSGYGAGMVQLSRCAVDFMECG